MERDYPRNKSEQTRFPSGLAWVFFLILFLGVALAVKVGLEPRSHASGDVKVEGSITNSTEPKAFLDLSSFYNAGHKTNWLGGGRFKGRDLAELPDEVHTYAGVPFDVRGVLQLRGAGGPEVASIYPRAVQSIPVGMKCRKLHFLHGTAWSAVSGTRVAAYNIHFADGTTLEVPLFYGANLLDYCAGPNEAATGAKAVWSTQEGLYPRRVYKICWSNPKPDMEVTSFDFVSFRSKCYPFLLAVTVE